MNVNMYFNTYNVGYLPTVSTQKPKKNTNCYIKPQFKFAFFDRRHFLVCMQPRCDHDTPPCSSILWHCPRVGDPFTYIFWTTFGVLIFSVSNLTYIKKNQNNVSNENMLIHFSKTRTTLRKTFYMTYHTTFTSGVNFLQI